MIWPGNPFVLAFMDGKIVHLFGKFVHCHFSELKRIWQSYEHHHLSITPRLR